MKKFAAFLMILSVSVFAVGCSGEKTPDKTPDKTGAKTDDGGTAEPGTKTDDGGTVGKTPEKTPAE